MFDNETLGLPEPTCPYCNSIVPTCGLEFKDLDDGERQTFTDCEECGRQLEIIARQTYDTYPIDE